MNKTHILLSALAAATLLSGCGGGGGSSSVPTTAPSATPTNTPTSTPATTTATINKNITITDTYQVESLGKASSINAVVSLGNTPKDLYILLSNDAATSGSTTIRHNAKYVASSQPGSTAVKRLLGKPAVIHAPQYVKDFSARLPSLLKKSVGIEAQAKNVSPQPRNNDSSGDSKTFYLDADGTQTTTATARKVISNIFISGSKAFRLQGCQTRLT